MIDFSGYKEYNEGYEAAKADKPQAANQYYDQLTEYANTHGVAAPEEMWNKDRAWRSGWWAYTDALLLAAFD